MTAMNLNLGVIGNCAIAMLVDDAARIVWGCHPRLDSDPVFDALLDGPTPCRADDPAAAGFFAVELEGLAASERAYLPNTAILRTVLTAADGGAVEVIDFAPRYAQFERMFRPPTVVRRLFPVRGRPRVRIRLRPRFGWGTARPRVTLGSNHVRYVTDAGAVRLTTDAPLSYVVGETAFALDRPVNLILGSDESLQAGVEETARMFHKRTLDHWREWVRKLSIPFEWQEAVIRAAITLKLCAYEETGAIVAALTTSIPEAPGTPRTWDYRLCWPRDAYFVVQALNRLGTTRTMEGYLGYIANIVDAGGGGALRPVHAITRAPVPGERVAEALAGYRGMGPVRVGNQAHEQVQNDVYGSMILAATHVFFDRRLVRGGDHELFGKLEILGQAAARAFDQPDAGPWELRGSASVHTFSSLMCWAACDRLGRIAGTLGLDARAAHWRAEAARLRAVISRRAWNERLNSFVATWDGETLDASILLLHELNFLAADDPRFAATVEAIGHALRRDGLLLRYAVADDFGLPETAFIVCTFWYIDALASLGRREEARELFESILARRSPLGLLSEDIHPASGELWGNFPQTYSMVGLINSAMRLSRSWEEAF